LRTLALDRPGVSVKGPWEIPGDVHTVHLGTYSPEHGAEICRLLEENDIVCWAKRVPPAVASAEIVTQSAMVTPA
jgi:hypothetical protein